MSQETRISTGYIARSQFKDFHRRKQRWAVIVAHRRAGKTVGCVNDLVDAALRCTMPNPRFAYIAPYFNQAKDIAWGYVREYTRNIPGTSYNEGELRADFQGGARIRLYGGDNPDRLRGLYLDGAVLDEPADMDPRLWPEIIRPALSDRRGWAVFIGTPRGRNEFYKIYTDALKNPEWFTAIMRASETGLLAAEELADAKRTMSEAQYAQEYECSFDAAILGAYYGREMADAAGRITNVPHYPGVPVETWWDLGINDSMAIWFAQRVGQEIHLIDYHEDSGNGLAHYAALLQTKARENGWIYGDHVWPHDGGHEQLATGESLADTFRKMGFSANVLEKADVGPGIDQVKRTLPRCWFDAAKCERGIEALRNYRTEWDDDKKTFKPKPLHDWASHGADAFRYGCQHIPSNGWSKPLKYDNRGII